MGCLFAKFGFGRRSHETLEEEAPKQYSCDPVCAGRLTEHQRKHSLYTRAILQVVICPKDYLLEPTQDPELRGSVPRPHQEARLYESTGRTTAVTTVSALASTLLLFVLASLASGFRYSLAKAIFDPVLASRDKRPKLDIKNYMFDGLKDQTVGKLPGAINGQQFIVQNCQNCNIYLYDHSSTVTVDDCVDCNFFIGPIKTSIFIRDCTGCKFVLACQQFRLRDCQKLDAFLCCATQPIIEASSGVRLACFNYYYPELEGQFKDAGLSVFDNNWSNIHDFSQDPTEKHYTLLPEDAKVDDYVPLPTGEDFQFLEISLDPDKSVVPRSQGSRRKTSDESCLLVFFYDGSSQERALSCIHAMKSMHPECVLIQTKELKMTPNDAERVFGSDAYTEVVSRGPVIGLEFNGNECIRYCQDVASTITKGSTGLVFVSQSAQLAEQQIENYYNFADMQMSV